MIQWLLLSALVALGACSDTPAEASSRLDHHDHYEEYENRRYEKDQVPLVYPVRDSGVHGPVTEKERIINDVYSPIYAEPVWILDYRFLKTGGRDYVRGPGGRIIILPPGVRSKEQKEFRNFDELIEHLRAKMGKRERINIHEEPHHEDEREVYGKNHYDSPERRTKKLKVVHDDTHELFKEEIYYQNENRKPHYG